MKDILTRYQKAFRHCRYSLSRNQAVAIKDTLQQLADSLSPDDRADVYGKGHLIESFEKQVATLLGKPAAVFMPSGTMAQPIALKIWADQQRITNVGLHQTSHLQLHEWNSYQALYGLHGVMIGTSNRVPVLQDLVDASGLPLAAILLELPMREIGGQLPEWESLCAQSEWARRKNIRLHMDGARLWQCPAYYKKSLAEISALFDSVYVSFYKDLGGISGAVLAGDDDFIATARIWQRRSGGNLYALFPYVIAAREGLNKHLPQMPERFEQARWLAAQLNRLEGVSTWPLKPQTNMFRLAIQCDPDTFLERASHWMEHHKVAIIPPPYQIGEAQLMCELGIGDAFGKLTQAQWQRHLCQFARDVLFSPGPSGRDH